jgi:hypothetical protein
MADMHRVKAIPVVVTGYIQRWDLGGDDPVYDWIDSTGDESSETFPTAQEAEDDFMRRY